MTEEEFQALEKGDRVMYSSKVYDHIMIEITGPGHNERRKYFRVLSSIPTYTDGYFAHGSLMGQRGIPVPSHMSVEDAIVWAKAVGAML